MQLLKAQQEVVQNNYLYPLLEKPLVDKYNIHNMLSHLPLVQYWIQLFLLSTSSGWHKTYMRAKVGTKSLYLILKDHKECFN